MDRPALFIHSHVFRSPKSNATMAITSTISPKPQCAKSSKWFMFPYHLKIFSFSGGKNRIHNESCRFASLSFSQKKVPGVRLIIRKPFPFDYTPIPCSGTWRACRSQRAVSRAGEDEGQNAAVIRVSRAVWNVPSMANVQTWIGRISIYFCPSLRK